MEDKDITALYFERSEQAVSETAAKYGGRFRRLALSFLDSEQDAEECINDALMKTWQSIPPNKPDDLFAYVARIVRCTAFNMIDRRQAAKRSALTVELTSELEECIPDRMAESDAPQELSELLNRFLASLPRDKRSIFIKRYWHGLSIAEICEATGFSESKVKSQLSRTRKELGKFLDRKGVSI